ncbi:MAG: 30S ribosomal protein S4 [Candidatus Omnitrophica bacterium]|nr:30S ribosomal protein S4 [Candidatus Omnitrophota bacterium]MCF7891873.1 30S ribosomal protein S4 [Candidatus Omnitrophota bacterium]MCF7896095.1 30S ribosomal protein S4 [Candidatus Omnitrophota bacterium]MCF7897692.1 30S ribosomal protein S4 [Candidatus Omnitrophota bacterium]MCF7909480.1 30S ribosomal protein S4 [Candidatus Omnitrophota bacterium]
MARDLRPKCKLCRRAGMKLFLKGIRCVTEKCAVAKRPTPPGMQKRQRSKPSYYALQLREKQKAKSVYGLLERQFRRFFEIAHKSEGATGQILIQELERRLDNIVFRSLFALSRSQARQFVRHGFIFIDNRRVDIPSFLVKKDQVIELRIGQKMNDLIKENIQISAKEKSVPEWLSVDNQNHKITIKRLPTKDDITIPMQEQLIVELYSK